MNTLEIKKFIEWLLIDVVGIKEYIKSEDDKQKVNIATVVLKMIKDKDIQGEVRFIGSLTAKYQDIHFNDGYGNCAVSYYSNGTYSEPFPEPCNGMLDGFIIA